MADVNAAATETSKIAPRIEVRLLGPFDLVVAGQTVHIGSVKQRAVLALLALQAGTVVSSEALCDVAWAQSQPASPLATLHSLVSRLRGALATAGGLVDGGREVLRTSDPGWVLDVDAESVDALRFGRLTARARQRAGRGDVAAAAADLAEAISLWRGAALVDIVDAGYLGPKATRLNEARLDAIEDLAEAELATGQHTKALIDLEEHVEANPLRERGWGLLMIALYRLGRQAAALRAFQQVRAILDDELGLEPSPALIEIEGRILRHDPSLAGPTFPGGPLWMGSEGRATDPTPPGDDGSQGGHGVQPTLEAGPGAQATPAGHGAQATLVGDFGQYSVLVVEDHDFQRRTVMQLLRGIGAGTVTGAANGNEALRVLATGLVPDVIVCDIDMPGMDGVEFVGRVAESGLACGLVITSGLESKVLRAVESIGESHGFQVLAALEKPLTARRLGEVLRQYKRLNHGRNDLTAHASVSSQELRSGLEDGQVAARFQPRIDLATGVTSSLDATGLWETPDRVAIPSSVFLPALARDGLLPAYIDSIVSDTCGIFDEAARVGVAIDGDMRVAVNVSLLRFDDGTVANRLTDTVRSKELKPGRFVWEIDDVVLARASSAAVAALTRLRVKGFGLAVRYSGTGPSFTGQLRRIPITEMRLDGRLVNAAVGDPAVLAMLDSAVGAARDAGLRAVGDGCDSAATFDALIALGCGEVMGTFIAEPMAASELVSRVLAGAASRS